MIRNSASLLAALLLALTPCVSAESPDAPRAAFRTTMDEVYGAFSKLQGYIYNKKVFLNPANEAQIRALLTTLNKRLHKADLMKGPYGSEPGFESTLWMAQEMLADTLTRFKQGKKGYAYWRIQSVSRYCVSCHTRYEVPADFYREGEQAVKKLDRYEQADFYFATRQFEKASQLFSAVIKDPKFTAVRLDALRKWLVIYTRVNPRPEQALTELGAFEKEAALSPFERKEIEDWKASLDRWAKEETPSGDPIAAAEKLIRRALRSPDIMEGRRGAVELLRATAILHRADQERNPEMTQRRAEVLYLLGLAYSHLPFVFVQEIPETFLGQCIREFPGSEEAQKSYRRYQEIIEAEYTGSGGTDIPAEEQSKLEQLETAAYGTKPN